MPLPMPVCSSLPLQAEESNGWVRYWVPASSFDPSGTTPNGGMLAGCGLQAGLTTLSKVELRNQSPTYDALICVDGVRLL